MNKEMLKKLQGAGTVQEVTAIAKEYGQEITEEKAGELLDRLKLPGGLSEDALEAVVGGIKLPPEVEASYQKMLETMNEMEKRRKKD